MITVLQKGVRDVELAAERGRIGPTARATFHAVALLVREERARVMGAVMSDSARNAQVKRVDTVATALARTAARDGSLLAMLDDSAELLDETRLVMSEMRRAAGLGTVHETDEDDEQDTDEPVVLVERRQAPRSVIAAQLANPFLAPDFSAPAPELPRTRRLASWELLGPLLKSFETASGGAPSCMDLPEPSSLQAPGGRELMRHQAQVVEAAAEGHRTFLLADEPGLGKTAQSLLAAQAAEAYPLLVVVPNVVKTNWAREVGLWTPTRTATVVHGDGDDVDGFSDIVIVNYDILDRHVGWLGTHGFRGMVVDEAHWIKNKTSQRSRHVLDLADRIRRRTMRPLMMALTGTPLINDVEDFLAIWQFLGWIGDKEPGLPLMAALEEHGLTPMDPGFHPAARAAVIDLGIVRRRKVDVAADIPARRIADLPVELDGALGRSIREAEKVLARRLVKRYESALAARGDDPASVVGVDHELVRRVATSVRQDADESGTTENVFTLMRKIGRAKAGLAADYAAQLARSAGKVVFFAKHIEVMDTAEALFEQQGIRSTSVRGDQTPKAREAAIQGFVHDPEVQVIVCSLTAAGVGLNLQVASDVVLAELSWTDAEQTQAIDRVHRIGQDQPVTAWRVIAAQTVDARVAELIDEKAGLAARALDGIESDAPTSVDLQVEAMVSMLTDALIESGRPTGR